MNQPSSAGTPLLVHNSEPSALDLKAELYRDFQPKIETVPIGSVSVYKRHARTHTKKQIGQIAESISAFGFISPLVVDDHGVVIAGHGRLAAAKKLKRTVIDVIRISHLSDPEKRALRIADNRLATLAGWDDAVLAIEFKDLLEVDRTIDLSFDLAITGFDHAEIDKLVDTTACDRTNGEDEVPLVGSSDAAVARPGDLWIMGDHRIICGDARDAAAYGALLGGEYATMSISDAPYNLAHNSISKSGKHKAFAMGVGEMSDVAFTAFLTAFLNQVHAFSKPGATHFAFMDWRHMPEMLAAGAEAGLKLSNLCIWNKASAGMGGNYRSQHELVFMWQDPTAKPVSNVGLGRYGRNRTNVWDFPGAAGLRKELELHPTPKPVSLVAEAIRDASNRNDIVLDAFSGSGTTIIAAAKTGRRARVVEIDPGYVGIAIERWQKWSGQKAVHAGTGMTFAEIAVLRAGQATAAAPSIANTAPTTADPVTHLPHVRVRTRPLVMTAA